MKKKLLVLGESYMNLQMKTNPPQKDAKTTYGSSYSFHPYGASAMTAISAAKLGGNCVFCTKIGDDSNGERLKKYYKSCGLDLSLMSTAKGEQTGMSVTLYNDITSGHTYITKGANLALTKKDIEDAFASYPDLLILPQDNLLSEKPDIPKVMLTEEIEPEDSPTEIIDIASLSDPLADPIVHDPESDFSETLVFSSTDVIEVTPPKTAQPIETEPEDNLTLYAAQIAMEKNVDMIVQYNRYTSKLPLEKIKGIKILVISDEMLYEVSGIYPNSIDKTLRAIIPFAAKIKSRYYIVQQGNDSVFIYDGKYYDIITLPAPLKSKAHQDNPRMHGTYIGALASRFLETRDIIDACKFASVASILTRSKFGCLDHAPSLKEIEEFTAEQ